MSFWISTISAKPNSISGPFTGCKGIVVNAVTYAVNKDEAIDSILNEISSYQLIDILIDDLEMFVNLKDIQNDKLRELALESKNNLTTECDTFYTYDK